MRAAPHLPPPHAEPAAEAPAPPPAPRSLAEAGLSSALVLELVVKVMYVAGECTGHEVARTLRLPPSTLEEVYVEVIGRS